MNMLGHVFYMGYTVHTHTHTQDIMCRKDWLSQSLGIVTGWLQIELSFLQTVTMDR